MAHVWIQLKILSDRSEIGLKLISLYERIFKFRIPIRSTFMPDFDCNYHHDRRPGTGMDIPGVLIPTGNIQKQRDHGETKQLSLIKLTNYGISIT